MIDYITKDTVFGKILNLVRGKFNNFNNSKENLKQTVNNFIEEYQGDVNSIEGSDIDIIHNVLSYGELRASDIMIPRSDIGALDVNASLDDIKKYIKEKRHTRFPVYNSSLDNIIGYINIKDLISGIFGQKKFILTEAIRDILVIAPSIKIIDLLTQMRKKKTHIALVVDEFGGTDGLITSEDIIEEIIGEIEDEHDAQIAPNYSLINENTMIANARLNIEEFEKQFGVKLSSENGNGDSFDTIGGLVLSLTSHVPERGERVKHPSGIEFEIIDSDPRKINKVIIRK